MQLICSFCAHTPIPFNRLQICIMHEHSYSSTLVVFYAHLQRKAPRSCFSFRCCVRPQFSDMPQICRMCTIEEKYTFLDCCPAPTRQVLGVCQLSRDFEGSVWPKSVANSESNFISLLAKWWKATLVLPLSLASLTSMSMHQLALA